MAELARGHVSDRPFARTIFAVALKRFSGEMVLSEATRTYRLGWKSGFVIAAQSASAQDGYGRIALAGGFINSTQLGQALRASPKANEELGPLAEAANLSAGHITKIEQLVMEAAAKRVFALENASFVVDDQLTFEPKPDTKPLDPRWLIYQGVKSHYTVPRLTNELAAVGNRPFRLTEQGLKNVPAFGLGGAEMAAIEALRSGPLTIDELTAAAPGMGRAVGMALVYALAVTNSIEPVTSSATFAAVSPTTGSHPAVEPPTQPRMPSVQEPPTQPRMAAVTAPPNEESAVISSAAPRHDSGPAVVTSAPPRGQDPAPPRGPRRKRHSDSALHRAREASVSISTVHGRSSESDAERNMAALRAQAMIEEKLNLVDSDADHFAILGVTRDTAPAEVRMAYFRIAKQLHPDRLRAVGLSDSDKDAHRLFARVNQAFSVISDPKKRKKYLDVLAEGGEAAVKAKQEEAEEAALKIFAAENEFLRGERALRHNQYKTALEAFEKAVELNPEEAEHHALLGWAEWCNAEDKEAINRQVTKRFTRAITLQPKCVPAFFYRGQIAKHKEDVDTAVECFRKVLELQPGHKEAELELRLLAKRGGAKKGDKGDKKGGLFDRLKRR